LQGIISISDRPGDFVFFVSYGQRQADHTFEEGVTEEGILTWQSQPRQRLSHPQIQVLIRHNEDINSIYLFLRPRLSGEYLYLGRLKYLSHDAEREQPVYFQWQILDWDGQEDVLQTKRLSPAPSAEPHKRSSPASGQLVLHAPPKRTSGLGKKTRDFKGRKRRDHSEREARNRKLGRAGELLVLDHERNQLLEAEKEDLAERVDHVAETEGDGAGYDIRSFELDGSIKYIEVKTTTGGSESDFFASANELAFSKLHSDNYHLYRVYEYDEKKHCGRCYIRSGSLEDLFLLEPTHYRVKV